MDKDELKKELERFKKEIDLCAYIESFGYVLDKSCSSTKTKIYRNNTDDKLGVSLGQSGYIYINNHDRNDHGTIIDFHQRRTSDSLAKTRIALRLWLDSPTITPSVPSINRTIIKDTAAVRHNYLQLENTQRRFSRFLLQRGLNQATQRHWRFNGRFTVDSRGNALFPHIGLDGKICGYEIRNNNFYGFSENGARGIWASSSKGDDQWLVVGESPIDLMSYFVLQEHGDRCRYIGTGGNWSDDAAKVLQKTVSAFPGEHIVFCHDNDKAGHLLMKQLTELLADHGERITQDLAPHPCKDWNQVLLENLNRR